MGQLNTQEEFWRFCKAVAFHPYVDKLVETREGKCSQYAELQAAYKALKQDLGEC